MLVQVFQQNGLSRFEALGEKFDPNLHSALFEIPDPSRPAGTVATVTKVTSPPAPVNLSLSTRLHWARIKNGRHATLGCSLGINNIHNSLPHPESKTIFSIA